MTGSDIYGMQKKSNVFFLHMGPIQNFSLRIQNFSWSQALWSNPVACCQWVLHILLTVYSARKAKIKVCSK